MLKYAFRMVRRKSNLGLNQSRTKTQRKQGPQQENKDHNKEIVRFTISIYNKINDNIHQSHFPQRPVKTLQGNHQKKRQLEEVTIEIKRQRTHLSENTHSGETREDQANTESESQ